MNANVYISILILVQYKWIDIKKEEERGMNANVYITVLILIQYKWINMKKERMHVMCICNYTLS